VARAYFSKYFIPTSFNGSFPGGIPFRKDLKGIACDPGEVNVDWLTRIGIHIRVEELTAAEKSSPAPSRG
jgi:hypothetical protein